MNAVMKSAPSLEQQRAAFAWKRITQVPRGDLDAYAKLAKGAPALIFNNGLMQALAYYEDKGKEHHRYLSEHLRQWLVERLPSIFCEDSQFGGVMQSLYGSAASEYRRATEEALAILRWIRQLAAAANKPEG